MDERDSKKTGLISEQRSLLMGLAILYILLYHQYFVQGFPIQPFARFGGWGVEVFMFASGIGIAYSLGKNSLARYFSNRCVRLLPAYIIALGVLTIALMTDGEVDRKDAADICNHWWFIKAILLFYLLAPLVKGVLTKWKWYGFWGIVSLDVLMLAGLATVPRSVTVGLVFDWRTLMMESCTRLPAFVLGMAMLLLPNTERRFMGKAVLTALPLLLAIAVYCRVVTAGKAIGCIPDWLLLDGGPRTCVFLGQRLLVCFITPAVCYVLARALYRYRHTWAAKAICFCGVLSLELYLMHELVFVNGAGLLRKIPGASASPWVMLASAFVAAFLAAWLLHCICGLPSKIAKGKRSVRNNG